MSDLWVFGYGSLIWKPGFPYLERHRASLLGRHRALCIYSVRYRGSSERPGLVFGLDAGGLCEGAVFRVASEHAKATIRYLCDREQVTGVYRVRREPVSLHDGSGRNVVALHFVADSGHQQYAGRLPLARQADIVRSAEGVSGPNIDYVLSTAAHLKELGIRDRELERLLTLTGRHAVGQGPHSVNGPRAPRLPPPPVLRRNHWRVLGL